MCMQLPFTTREEILEWEARYIEEQSEYRQSVEQTVMGFKENVRSRRTHEIPNGYLKKEELCNRDIPDIPEWLKKRALRYHIVDQPEDIKRITGEAFALTDDWQKLSKLREIKGAGGKGGVVASAILHLCDEGCYPFFSPYARRAIGIKQEELDETVWREYVNLCRAKAECYGVCMRTLDRALYAYDAYG